MKLWQTKFLTCNLSNISNSSPFLTDSYISKFCFLSDFISLCASCHFSFLLPPSDKELLIDLYFNTSTTLCSVRAGTSNGMTEPLNQFSPEHKHILWQWTLRH